MTLLHDGLVQGLVTVLAFVSFIGVCFYAYAPSRRRDFERAARLPMAEDRENRENRENREERPS